MRWDQVDVNSSPAVSLEDVSVAGVANPLLLAHGFTRIVVPNYSQEFSLARRKELHDIQIRQFDADFQVRMAGNGCKQYNGTQNSDVREWV